MCLIVIEIGETDAESSNGKLSNVKAAKAPRSSGSHWESTARVLVPLKKKRYGKVQMACILDNCVADHVEAHVFTPARPR
jgi:hypothetical protein